MRVTVTDTYHGKTVQFDVGEDLDFAAFRCLVDDEFGSSSAARYFFFEGEILKILPNSTLKSLNIKDQDIIVLTHLAADASELEGVPEDTTRSTGSRMPFFEDTTLLARYMNLLTSTMPKSASNYARGSLPEDSQDPEAQALLLKAIHQQRIDESFANAQEYFPESFGSVNMLYIAIYVNDTLIKALVDSGAQMTIISSECAERCGLTRLIDSRFYGIARGLGTSSIVGRIHLVHMKIGKSVLPIALTVVKDNKTDLIFGLDLLRRYQCVIDLRQGTLNISDDSITFLSEAEIPKGLDPDMSAAIE